MKALRPLALTVPLLAMAGPAWAHPGHGTGLIAGVLHPLTGPDHLAAMLLVGVWAGVLGRRMTALLPATFLAAILAGFGFGWAVHAGAMAMVAEMLIIASLLALGVAVAVTLRSPAVLGIGAVGLFGFAHGLAHGIEAPAGALPLGFALGFFLSTAALHAFGILLAERLPTPLVRAIGVAGAGLGMVLAGTS